MDPAIWLPALTSAFALVFSVLLFDQWRVRRGGFQLIWAFGMLFYGIAAGSEALAAIGGWNETLYRTWYLTGAVWTAGWLGLGTAFLLGRTRFGYSFALCLFLAGLFTFLIRNKPEYAGRRRAAAAVLPGRRAAGPRRRGRDLLLRTSGGRCSRRPRVVGATLLSIVLMVATVLPAPGYALDPRPVSRWRRSSRRSSGC